MSNPDAPPPPPPSRSSPYTPALRPGEGLLAFLARAHFAPVLESGALAVTSSDEDESFVHSACHLCDFSPAFSFCTHDRPGQWACYDFKRDQVSLASYSLCSGSFPSASAHPRNWSLEGSSDGSSWSVLDARTDNNDLNGSGLTATFSVSNRAWFRLIRLRQTGPNHAGNHTLLLSSLELFGRIMKQSDPEPTPPPPSPVAVASAPLLRMTGVFKVRHARTRNFLALGCMIDSETMELRFDTSGEIFTAEDQTAPFTRVLSANGFAWCSLDGKLVMRKHPGLGNEFLFRFQDGHVICRLRELALTTTKSPVMKPLRANTPKQMFELLVPVLRKQDKTRASRANGLVGEFQVRHIASGRFLKILPEPWRNLDNGLGFADEGDVFAAESHENWTRVIGRNGFFWCVLMPGVPSEFGLNRSTDKAALFAQFQAKDGYIGDHQKMGRVMTVGKDGRAWFQDKEPGLVQAQQFKIIVRKGAEGRCSNPGIPMSQAISFDSFALDKFE
jgi:hypothetical protein